MEFLRSKHPTMAQVLEVVLGDIGTLHNLTLVLLQSCTVTVLCLPVACFAVNAACCSSVILWLSCANAVDLFA